MGTDPHKKPTVPPRGTAALILEHAVEPIEALPKPARSVPLVLIAPVAGGTAPKVRGIGFREVPKWRMKCGHERSQAVSFHRALRLGNSEFQLKRGSSESVSAKSKRCVHISGWPTSKVRKQR